MSRLIEIISQDGLQKLNDDCLPLIIGSADDAHIHIEGFGGPVAYVGESRNHLFLQPAEVNRPDSVLHNDEILNRSVWLKSGDVTRLGDTLIRWIISGQRLEIRLSHASGTTLLPPDEPPQEALAGNANKTNVEAFTTTVPGPSQSRKRLGMIIISLFIILLISAGFVLLAKPLEVLVTPSPDKLDVIGFPLVVKFGANYLGLPGNYQVVAEKTGYQPLRETVLIDGPENRFQFELEKLPGLLDVSSRPPGAVVVVDGNRIGKTPLTKAEVAAGLRVIELVLERYLTYKDSLKVKGFGERQQLNVDLSPAWASIKIQSEPAGAVVLIDGEERGVSPVELELLEGTRRLVLQKESFSPFESDIEVIAGQDLVLPAYNLLPAPASINLSSDPPGAMVEINGQFKGRTPVSLSLVADLMHEIRLRAVGYKPRAQTLKFSAGDVEEVFFKLSPEFGVIFITTEPPDATLLIDGTQQLHSVGRFRLPARDHKIEVRAEGYKTDIRTITPQANLSQRVEINLKPEQPNPVEQTAQTIRADHAVTSLGQKLVLVKPKSFRMGASRNEAGRRANENEHDVILKRPFYMADKEVTNREYRLFKQEHSSGMSGNRSLEGDNQPVVNISWEEAARYLNWLSKQDGLPPFYREDDGKMMAFDQRGSGYRLPTEAEWAFAARMAKRNQRARYPWEGTFPPKKAVENYADESARHILPSVIEGYTDGFAVTAPVGSYDSNPAGFYDLGGNVAEWCHDYYSAHLGTPDNKSADPMGPIHGTHRVVRGASWRDASITEVRLSFRRYSRDPANDIGFRFVRSAE
ncbi:MAG: PEGA domain-containing protein [Deltaproteobacteria bacterium]|nr:PEGA domain-containing protein [Deltaproteobacteria bacterium]